MNWIRKASAVSALVFAATISCVGQRALAPDDLYRIRTVMDPQLSPDGALVAYTVSEANASRTRWHNEIWIVPTQESAPPHRFTANGYSAKLARWSPDGRSIAFVASPDKLEQSGEAAGKSIKQQIFLQALEAKDAHPLTSFQNGVTEFAWSPTGNQIVCVAASRSNPAEKRTSDSRHYLHPTYKEDERGFLDDRRRHLWVIDLASRSVTQITQGNEWDDTDPRWSPDGQKIAFYSDRSGLYWEQVANSTSQLWTVTADGKTVTKIADHATSAAPPQWSKDAKRIAYFSREREDGPRTLRLAPSSGAASARDVLTNLDLSVHGLTWSQDDRFLYFISNERGEAHALRVDVVTEALSVVVGGARFVRSIDVNAGCNCIVFTASAVKHPAELYAAGLESGDERLLSHANDAFLNSVKLQDVSRISYTASDGLRIDGFLVRPVNWEPTGKYPLVLLIHGGPQGMYGMDWLFQVQLFATHGWTVLYTNPRGSSGYGTSFVDAAVKEWGGSIYTDLMAGIDWVIAHDPSINAESLGVTGCSFGGYMTNWIISQTNRFQAAVPMCSISNYISDEGTRDAYYGHSHDFGGDLYENFDLYWRYSPIRYAGNVRTPTLILHGEADQRVPLEQAEQWFRALHHFRVTSEFVIFPRESHEGLLHGEPRHVSEVMQWQVYWFEKYLNRNAAAISPDAPVAYTSAIKH